MLKREKKPTPSNPLGHFDINFMQGLRHRQFVLAVQNRPTTNSPRPPPCLELMRHAAPLSPTTYARALAPSVLVLLPKLIHGALPPFISFAHRNHPWPIRQGLVNPFTALTKPFFCWLSWSHWICLPQRVNPEPQSIALANTICCFQSF